MSERFLIYSTASKEWFREPGRGLTRDRNEAHRFTREEAELQCTLRYNTGCRIEPVSDESVADR